MASSQKFNIGVVGSKKAPSGAEKLDTSGFFTGYIRVSGGIFVDTAVHDIDLTLSFLREDVVPKELWARGLIAHHHDLADLGDVNNAIGVVKFWNGTITHSYRLRTTVHGYDNCTGIIGSKGKVSVNLVPNRNRVQVVQRDGYCAGCYAELD
ncbi:hypothetical protein N8T08_000316 [Aspergillus melleus]|uniref:Uncharacterized protein n=1 Tax=Aspergillus melleus TaxID=138277 RepID=A0ACC3BAV4_9EURO|nr:hypothetical protein N8T08_000316 [Aspergillus melleus]